MECIEARALKSSALSEMGVKNNVFNYNDDVWCLTEINNSDENFPVEDLLNLDFHEKEIQEEGLGLDEEDDEEEKGAQETNSNHSSTTTFSGGSDEFDSLSAAGELAVPADDLENLEWLSQFVDDSTAGLSLLCPVGNLTVVNPGKRIDPATRPSRKFRVPFLPSPVPRKPRTNCPARPNRRRPWFLSLPPSTAVAESSAATTSSNGSSPFPPLLFLKKPAGPEPDWFRSVENPPAKKQRRPPEADSGRRCTHCQVNRTPQWRTGPLGPKTLCNACGVRYKSGRLFPEYRPACSPTFSKEMHSNSHRKVLEMRRKKDVAQGF